MTEPVAVQGCLDRTPCTRAASMGAGLVWVRSLGVTKAASLLGHPDLPPVCTIKVNREHKQWHSPNPSTQERISSTP